MRNDESIRARRPYDRLPKALVRPGRSPYSSGVSRKLPRTVEDEYPEGEVDITRRGLRCLREAMGCGDSWNRSEAGPVFRRDLTVLLTVLLLVPLSSAPLAFAADRPSAAPSGVKAPP